MNANHKIDKPRIFISHATSDGEFANAVRAEIEKVFADGVSVFCTSSPGTIAAGADWLEDIEEKLNVTQAVIAIVTPTSIDRPWLWFELGATWKKSRNGDCPIYPLCAAEVKLTELPVPLDRLQALSMSRATDLKLLFEALIKQFGFGKISSFRSSNITRRIPKYRNVVISKVDLGERSFYSGRYTGYSDDELMEILDTELFRPDQEKVESSRSEYLRREDVIHLGKLLHFRKIDTRLDLPPGTTKNLVVEVGKRYALEPDYLTENVARFTFDSSR